LVKTFSIIAPGVSVKIKNNIGNVKKNINLILEKPKSLLGNVCVNKKMKKGIKVAVK
jgi:hypothetical protein